MKILNYGLVKRKTPFELNSLLLTLRKICDISKQRTIKNSIMKINQVKQHINFIRKAIQIDNCHSQNQTTTKTFILNRDK